MSNDFDKIFSPYKSLSALEKARLSLQQGKAEKALVTLSTQAIHPDKWLSPIKGMSVAPVIRELEAA